MACFEISPNGSVASVRGVPAKRDLKLAIASLLACLTLFACGDDDATPAHEMDAAVDRDEGMDASRPVSDGHDGGRMHATRMDAAIVMIDAGHVRHPTHARHDAGHPLDAGRADDDAGSPSTEDDGGAGAEPTCFALRAHAAGSAGAFGVASGADSYALFSFAPHWPSSAHAVSYQSLVDNASVIAEMRLRATPNALSDGAVAAPGSHAHQDTWLLGMWAPGAPDYAFPLDSGIRIGAGITLEVHYANQGAAATDTSGFVLCALDAPFTHELAWHVLGTTSISGASASGTCDPSTSDPIQLLQTWPTMRAHGANMKLSIQRQVGSIELIYDHPFDFSYQALYDTPAVVYDGDTITTQCQYDKTVAFGPNVADEECFAFVLAYPAGALSRANAALDPVYGRNVCLP